MSIEKWLAKLNIWRKKTWNYINFNAHFYFLYFQIISGIEGQSPGKLDHKHTNAAQARVLPLFVIVKLSSYSKLLSLKTAALSSRIEYILAHAAAPINQTTKKED